MQVKASDIGVIIPVYNGEKYLSALFESLRSQSQLGFSVYVMLDGSQDNSEDIAHSFEGLFESFHVFSSKENKGVSITIKSLVEIAMNDVEYVLLLAQDDFIPINYVEKVLEKINQNPQSVIAPVLLNVGIDGQRIPGGTTPIYFPLLKKFIPALLLNNNFLASPGMVFPGKSFSTDLISDKAFLTHDWQQWLTISLDRKIVILDSTQVYYRIHSQNNSLKRTNELSHKEMSLFLPNYFSSSNFTKYMSSLSIAQKYIFYGLYLFFQQEFRKCRHQREWLKRLRVLTWHSPQKEKKVIKYSPCGYDEFPFKVKPSARAFGNNCAKMNFREPRLGRLLTKLLVTKATNKFLLLRVYSIFRTTTTQILRELRMKRIYCVAGLGGQLNALAYSIWIKDNIGVNTRIRFTQNHLALTENRLGELLNFFEYEEVINKKSPESNSEPQVLQLKLNSLGFIVKNLLSNALLKMKIIIRSDHLSKLALAKVRPWTKYIQGYHSDSRILMESIPRLSNLISQTELKNFLVDAGSHPSISIHWRLGDYLSNPKNNHTHGVIEASQVISCIHNLPKEKSNFPIIIFSDSINLVKEYLAGTDFFERIIFVNMDIWSDLYKMSRSEIFVGSHSSISVWAALSILNSNPNALVYLPTYWFKNTPEGFSDPKNPFILPQEAFPQIQSY
jgi:glycosyltransferase involved in cell wall biosynthesis